MVDLQHDSQAIQAIGSDAFSLAEDHEAREARETHAAEQPPSLAAAPPRLAPVAMMPLPSPPPTAAPAAPPAQLIRLQPHERAALGPVLSGLYDSAAARMVHLQHDSEAIQVVGNHAFSLAVQHEAREARQTQEELDELEALLPGYDWPLGIARARVGGAHAHAPRPARARAQQPAEGPVRGASAAASPLRSRLSTRRPSAPPHAAALPPPQHAGSRGPPDA